MKKGKKIDINEKKDAKIKGTIQKLQHLNITISMKKMKIKERNLERK